MEHLLDEDTSWPSEIALTNARGAYATSIAQYTIAAILRVAEKVDQRREQQLTGRWPEGREDDLLGDTVRGKTLVIVGYGGIGREIARLAAAHGMRVIAVKANPTIHADDGFRHPGTGDPDGSIPERIAGIEALREVVAEADFVSITLPLTAASRGVVSREVLGALPGHAWLDQHRAWTGRRRGCPRRGPCCGPHRWRRPRRLRGGAAAHRPARSGACPTSSSPRTCLGRRPRELPSLVAENLRRFVAGDPLLNRVDPERGY